MKKRLAPAQVTSIRLNDLERAMFDRIRKRLNLKSRNEAIVEAGYIADQATK